LPSGTFTTNAVRLTTAATACNVPRASGRLALSVMPFRSARAGRDRQSGALIV
jgi:hypothetical protein